MKRTKAEIIQQILNKCNKNTAGTIQNHIQKSLKISPQMLYKYMNLLVKKNCLIKKERGRLKVYSITNKGKKIMKILNITNKKIKYIMTKLEK